MIFLFLGKDDIKAKERNTCCYLSFLVTVLTTMSNITIQLGPLSELLTKNVAFLYNTLNSLAKYFVLRSSKSNVAFQGARYLHKKSNSFCLFFIIPDLNAW